MFSYNFTLINPKNQLPHKSKLITQNQPFLVNQQKELSATCSSSKLRNSLSKRKLLTHFDDRRERRPPTGRQYQSNQATLNPPQVLNHTPPGRMTRQKNHGPISQPIAPAPVVDTTGSSPSRSSSVTMETAFEDQPPSLSRFLFAGAPSIGGNVG